MQRMDQFYAVDQEQQVHTVVVYQQALGLHVYRLDDRESLELVDEKWFVTQAGDVLERVVTTRCSSASEIS